MGDDWVDAEVPVALGKMGPDAFDLLRALAVDTMKPVKLQTFAAEALADVSERHAAVREAGVATLMGLLRGFEHQELGFNTIVASCLVSLEVREAAPFIEAAFASAQVDPGFLGDWEDVQEELGLIPDETFLSLLECEDTAIQFVLREISVDAVGNANRRLDVLERFLSASGRPHAISSVAELRGFLFAMACTPGEVEISAWVKWALEQNDDFADLREGVEVMWAIGDLFQRINAKRLEPGMPEGVTFHADPLANLAGNASVARWSRGLLAGHDWLRHSWEPLTPDEEAVVEEILPILTFFASARMAEQTAPALADRWGVPPEEVASSVVREWPGHT
jgi:yecA family protein